MEFDSLYQHFKGGITSKKNQLNKILLSYDDITVLTLLFLSCNFNSDA